LRKGKKKKGGIEGEGEDCPFAGDPVIFFWMAD